jgi:hypothetical protein
MLVGAIDSLLGASTAALVAASEQAQVWVDRSGH